MTLAADPTLTTPGPRATNEQLAAWRDAVTRSALPAPTRSRYQILRAGAANLWEYDVAEVWFADGRAQFVGGNQTGKSTLMALTTLIMLAGSLDRKYVDTFGQAEKDFRYYVEPTGADRDRREAVSTTNRGWAWVEYGRITDDGTPEFFTTLLYAQAKRGVSQMTRAWVVCHGTARVRDGIDLVVGLHVTEPKELAALDGVTVYDTGRRYAERLATDLFGFADSQRYATVIEMLKTLRTPQLGQKLNPDWFTTQIRSALPPIADSEIAGLAEGWQQLEQLGRDRDSAIEAREAITVYVRRAWQPWADSVLRLRAEELIAANTAFGTADAAVTETKRALDEAREKLTAETARTDRLEAEAEENRGKHTELLHTAAYRDAAGRTANAHQLQSAADAAKDRVNRADQALSRARQQHDRAAAEQETSLRKLTGARTARITAAELVTTRATAAGFGDQVPVWVGDADIDRLDAAAEARRGQVNTVRRLLRDAAAAAAEWKTADDAAGRARKERQDREAEYSSAQQGLSDQLQELSDTLERWAATLGELAPAPGLRDDWVRQITEQASASRPRPLLAALLARQWLEPAISPLRDAVAALNAEVTATDAQAADADAKADLLAQAGDSVPAAPGGWARRERPVFPGPDGAPLWRLVDTVPGLDEHVLDRVEAALAAAGLLDAWVTTDGMWSAGRDGDEIVVVAPAPAPGGSLAQILQPAADAGPLTANVTDILAGIGYTPSGPLTAPVTVAGDGRWQTPAATGRAGRAEHGAELIGAAARAAARQRQITELRATAGHLRATAGALRTQIRQLEARMLVLHAAYDSDTAPHDDDVVAAAAELVVAARELDRARTNYRGAQQAEQRARTRKEDTAAAVTGYAAEHELPVREEQLEKLSDEINAAVSAIGDLNLAVRELSSVETAAAVAATAVETTAGLLDDADNDARDARQEAALAQLKADEAVASIERDDQGILDRERELDRRTQKLKDLIATSRREGAELGLAAERAVGAWQNACTSRDVASAARDAAALAWWVPVDAGLAAARGLPTSDGRDLDAALHQAGAAVQTLRPPNWTGNLSDRRRRAEAAQSRMTQTPLLDMRTLLESSGGRSVILTDVDETHPLPEVSVIVDASGVPQSPTAAVRSLDDLVEQLTRAHDEKLHQMYNELLSSTFINHLAGRLKQVIELLKNVNAVLGQHPTGLNRTTLRLVRHPADGHRPGWQVLKALEDGTIESAASQQQIRAFLTDRLREARDAGLTGTEDWTDRLADLLDYRKWFDVVCEYRLAVTASGEADRWKPLTRQAHAVDSGGGKVVTLLQPLLATLVALYSESPHAPRPLWLDEAFEGVDAANRATMMAMLVDFDLDFLLAGPVPLVAAAQIPAAALWVFTRAPAPLPGVDLSLMLWAGQTLEQVNIGDHTVTALAARKAADDADSPDLFTTIGAEESAS